MRRHKALARIFLFLSIVDFTFAGDAQIPMMDEMPVDLVTGADDVTVASETGHTQSGVLPKLLGRPSMSTAGNLHSRQDVIPAQSFNHLEDPESKKFFNKELIRRMKEYLVLGAVAGLFTGVANGIQKQIAGTVSPGATTVGRSVEPLDEYPQDQEDLVSRSLSNMKDEDLQMLSIISRGMLNNLD